MTRADSLPGVAILGFSVIWPLTSPAGPLLTPGPQSPMRIQGSNLIAGDVNGDGKIDLLVRGQRLHVLLGDGAGRFVEGMGSPLQTAEPMSEMALADVDGDGKLDLAGMWHDSYALHILIGDGHGKLSQGPGSPFVTKRGGQPHTHGLVAADLNNDGKADLVSANNEDGDLAVMLGNGKGEFAPSAGSPFPCGKSPYPIAAADVDGDENIDVVVPNSGPGIHTVTVMLGDGKGGLRVAAGSPIACSAYFVALGDLNGDAKVDVVASNGDNDLLAVCLNEGKARFAAAAGSPLKMGSRAWGVEIAEMNGDGKMDVVLAGENVIRVYLGDGRGGFTAAEGSPFAAGKGTWRLAVGDFDGDGMKDVAATCLEEGKVVVLVSKGK